MRKKIVLVTAILLAQLSSFAHGQEPSSSPAALTMKVYMGVCVPSGGSYSIVSSAANGMRLTRLAEDKTERFLRGTPGKVWATGDENGLFALALTDDGTCTVFVRRVDSTELTALFTSWLPPAGSSFRTEKIAQKSENGVTTTSYAIYRDGRPYQSWVLMVSDGGSAQGAVSVRPASP